VIEWNALAGQAAMDACLSPTQNPLHEARMYAMSHVAIHDALNAIRRRFEPYAFDARVDRHTSAPAAVAAAARGVLVPTIRALPAELVPATCVDHGVATVEEHYREELAAIPDGAAKRRGIAVGERAAAAIVAKRADDGNDTPPLVDTSYPQGDEPGEYRFTPGTPFAFAPRWGEVTPFVLRDAKQFRAGPPYPLTSRRYARDLNEVERFGGDGEDTPSARSPEQTEIALFWVESSPLAWNRIARTVASDRGLDAWEAARLFGLLNMAMADGYVGTFETKYHYNLWRPVTAIRLADTDGNPDTVADPDWTPLVTTPPIPEHDSGHSVEGAAAAQVMRRVLGTDQVQFTACSHTLPAGNNCGEPSQVLRNFNSFTQATIENGESRILVGFHFRHAIDDGLDHGRHIADRAVNHYMRPESAAADSAPNRSGPVACFWEPAADVLPFGPELAATVRMVGNDVEILHRVRCTDRMERWLWMSASFNGSP
jgi:VCPO second helical-bundle domain